MTDDTDRDREDDDLPPHNAMLIHYERNCDCKLAGGVMGQVYEQMGEYDEDRGTIPVTLHFVPGPACEACRTPWKITKTTAYSTTTVVLQ